ncbi:MAG: DNA-binding protein [Verrucomicrobia bacterium]|nr:DNA-binding protein [Verrucomicrobiota bacterium]
MNPVHALTCTDPHYPDRLRRWLGEAAPETLSALGHLDLLEHRLLALLSSVHCPGRVVQAAYAFAQRLRYEGQTVIGGFHSPMEQECLRILLSSPHGVVLCPARGLEDLRLRPEWRRALSEQRLLLLSPFAPLCSRATAQLASERNRFVAALADEVVIAHVTPGGQMERLLREVSAWGKPCRRLDLES